MRHLHVRITVCFLLSLVFFPISSSERILKRHENDDSTNSVNDECAYNNALPCENGSTCKMGKADFGYHGTLNLPFLNKTAEDFMHCYCQDGYTGVLCEHHVQTCGDNEHAFFNGATCVKVENNAGQQIWFSCDCMTTHSTNVFAGHV